MVAARGAAGARLRAVRLVDDFFVSGPLQQAALELVSAPAWRRHLKPLRGALRERRDALAAAVARDLPDLRLAPLPDGGLHLWGRLPDHVDDVRLAADAAGPASSSSAGTPFFAADAPGLVPAPDVRRRRAREPRRGRPAARRRLPQPRFVLTLALHQRVRGDVPRRSG